MTHDDQPASRPGDTPDGGPPPTDSPEPAHPARADGDPTPRSVTPDRAEAPPPGGDPDTSTDSGPDSAPTDVDLFGNAPHHRRDWSHRRGEPRVFALLWTVFLTVIATTTLMRAAIGGRLDLAVYRAGLTTTLMVIATGIVVGWPLLRLSQARPRGGGVGTTFKDVLIVLVPLQAVLWPQAVLAHWPLSLVAALDATLAAWTLLCGGVVALALGPRTEDPDGLPDAEALHSGLPRGRVAAMAIVIGLGAVGGAAAFVLDIALRPDRSVHIPGSWWMMLSPHTAIAELTRDRAEFGETARAQPAHLWATAAQTAAGLLLWVAAAAREWLAPPPVQHESGVATRPKAR